MRGGVFALLQRILHLRKRNNGGILIEFAFSIPVCITFLFFVHDHYRFYELKSKIKSSTYLVASMIQQIGNMRTNKQLTMRDIKQIAFAGTLNLFHSNSMFYPYPFGVQPMLYCQYIKRISKNEYKWQGFFVNAVNTSTSPDTLGGAPHNDYPNKTSTEIADIHPDMVCYNDGEERLLINVWLHRTDAANISSSKLGFFFLQPVWGVNWYRIDNKGSFSYAIVITPKLGLFPVKN